MNFVKIFGILISIIFIAYGIAVIIIGVEGLEPCGATCSLNEALLRLLGQRKYDLAYGLSWIISGVLFLLFILLKKNKEKRGRRERKLRERRNR